LASIDFGTLFIALGVLLFSLTIHESAHAWSANRLGDPTARLLGRISLNPVVHVDPIGTLLLPLLAFASGAPIIGWAKPVPVNVARLPRGRRDFLLVAAAGPASNLVLAVGAAVLLRAVAGSEVPMIDGATTIGEPLRQIATWTLRLNVLLAVFNMLPIPPLDGGNVLAGLLPDALAAPFDRLRPYGFLMLYALLFTGTLGAWLGPPYVFLMRVLTP
jgi:Zn-dependent protease